MTFSAAARSHRTPLGLMIAAAAAVGVGLRVWVYRSGLGVPDSDEALVGLMVHSILHGTIPTFYPVQAYGGSQEALLTAPLFALFGSSWLALRIVPIALSALAAILVWRVGRRTIGEPAAAIAGALYWIWPPFVIDKLTHQFGFYASTVVYCTLLTLLALRIVERPDRIRVATFGLVFGLAWWQSAQIVPVVVPLVAWTVWRQPRALRFLWAAVPLALIGALPWIVWNIGHGWESLIWTHPPGSSTYIHRFRVFVSPVLPMMLGLRAPFSQQALLPTPVIDVLYVALLAAFAVGAWRTRSRPVGMLFAIAFVYPFIYAINPLTFHEFDPGYVVALSPVLALLVARLAVDRRRAAVLLLVAAIVSAVSFQRMNDYRPGVNVDPKPPRDLHPLVSLLDRLHLDRVYASYWLSYVLVFDTNERIIAGQNQFEGLTFLNGKAIPSPDGAPRMAAYEPLVARSRYGFAFLRDDGSVTDFSRRLGEHGYRRYQAGDFIVYSRPPG